MNLVEVVIGARPRWLIDEPPARVKWRRIRAKTTPPVRAHVAEADTSVETSQGELVARGGADYIVTYDDGARSVVRGDIFKQTYAPNGDGTFSKRTDVILRCFTLDRDATVETLEGPQHAKRGDWVIEGVKGELWPVPKAKARRKYQSA